jgi:hypothetical protein
MLLAPALFAVQLLAAAPAPGAAVLVSRRTATSAADAAQKAARIGEVLASLKVALAASPGTSAERLAALEEDPARCEGDRSCLASLGRRLQAAVVVTVDLSLVLDEYALRIEAIDSQHGTLLGTHKTSGAWAVINSRLENELRPMAYSIATQLRSAEAMTALKPAPPSPEEPPRPAVTAPVETRPASRLPLVLGIGAAASAVGAAVLLGVGLGHKGTLDRLASEGPPFALTRAEAEQTMRSANLELTLAIGFGVLALALAVTAVVTGLAQ